MVEITSQTNLSLSIYLIKTNKKMINELDQREIDAAVCPTECSIKYNALFYDFGNNMGTYMVIPTNYNKGEGVYEVKFSTTKPIDIKEGVSRDYLNRKDYFMNLTNDPRYVTASPQRSVPM